MKHQYTREYALQLDEQDPLAQYRHEFYINKSTIYLDGNSLGLLSKRAEATIQEIIDAWKTYGIDGWTEGANPWFYLSEKLGEQMAPLVGATPAEVIVTGSTTVNLHQLLSTFYRPTEKKAKILADELNFPSDIYAIKSQLNMRGLDPEKYLVQVKSEDGYRLEEDDIIAKMTEDISLIVLPSVLYRSGQILNMKRITEEAHKRNILVAFDLCHSIGSIPPELSKWDVDFAFWCNYKHLNGGPGATGGMFVNQRHFGNHPGLAGWFGSRKDKQFDMDHEMSVDNAIGAFQIGTPNILSMAPLVGALSMFNEVGMTHIRNKSLQLTSYFMDLIRHELKNEGFALRNPLDDTRAGHILLQHKEAARICKALKVEGVIPDYRSPDGIRLAPVALYNTFEDVWNTVQILKTIMEEKKYKKYDNKRGVVA
ncbi:kynureninase [Cytobacillus horneckiae]|uniref:Kynureninase n=1 Tax=Cytobacillus horneckiae TaxID=549687 RepID=A0A2N0ZGG3_9BACI|nr:kynureninase [Cytobacillus horneckiae]MBN6888237.1 kynureninase [Cytobacillus horneckiae]MEC1154792.1 kynureninase [Cytobacillus horneckiae]MED2940286.1 kynureninase [Cytobacillus horneckiae]PKG28586.1 kynureninase [Cytobacillus horneckiae]